MFLIRNIAASVAKNVKLGKEMEILCFFLAVYSVANNWHFEW